MVLSPKILQASDALAIDNKSRFQMVLNIMDIDNNDIVAHLTDPEFNIRIKRIKRFIDSVIELAGGGTTVKTWFGVYLLPPLSPPGGAGWATGKL